MHCEDELLLLLIKVDWPMAKQDFWGREKAGQKRVEQEEMPGDAE